MQALNILQITDTHLYAGGNGCLLGLNTEQSLQAVISDARKRFTPVDMILATGDLVHDGTPAAYRRVFSHLEEFAVPVFCLAGNHDEAHALENAINGGLINYSSHVQKGHWHFIFLDSSIEGSEGGHLSATELRTLEMHLQSEPHAHTLVCLHHQPVATGSRWLDTMAVDNADEFFTIIDRYPQVRGILWGHVHQEIDSMRGTVRLMSTPSTCIQFLPGSDEFALDNRAPGYRWLKLHADGQIESGVQRLASIPGSVDLASAGY